jgi:hypothetical protein
MLAAPLIAAKLPIIRLRILQFIEKYFDERGIQNKPRTWGKERAIFHILGELYAEATGEKNPAEKDIKAKTQYGRKFPANILQIVRLTDEHERERIAAIVAARLPFQQMVLSHKRRAMKSYSTEETAELTSSAPACVVPVTNVVVAKPYAVVAEAIPATMLAARSATSSLFIQTALEKQQATKDLVDSWFAPSPTTTSTDNHPSVAAGSSNSGGVSFWQDSVAVSMQIGDEDCSTVNSNPNVVSYNKEYPAC